MSEFVTFKDLGEIQKTLGSMESKLGTLDETIKQQHSSMIPFIEGVNKHLKKLEDEDLKLDKKITKVDNKTSNFSFRFLSIWAAIMTLISLITNFVSDKIAFK